MKIVSVNVGLPRPVAWRGRRIMTGIYKDPVEGRVRARRTNLDGDGQADLSVHGGPEKAVYLYPSEHYPFWRRELELEELPWGSFGENLTAEGWWEDEVHVGDRFRIGTAEFAVTQPRMPCFKLAMKFDRDDVVETFLESGRPGFYLAVTQEGELGAGDAMERIHEDENGVTVVDVVRLYMDRHGESDPDLLRRAVAVEALSEGWREHFRKRLPPHT
ncbi:MAG TPA: MOSC domain-containing protein [Thermoanaerobaculia bacterium]|jgi:MOSC domain-containing protein YiiM|nr:MOSC domain-containing protein [Thermoanaerobaculia bacterium]